MNITLPKSIENLEQIEILEKYTEVMILQREYSLFSAYYPNLLLVGIESIFEGENDLKGISLSKNELAEKSFYFLEKKNGDIVNLNDFNHAINKLDKIGFDYNKKAVEFLINQIINLPEKSSRFELYKKLFSSRKVILELIGDLEQGKTQGLVFDESKNVPIVKYCRSYNDYNSLLEYHSKLFNDKNAYFKLNMEFLLLYVIEKSRFNNITCTLDLKDTDGSYYKLSNNHELGFVKLHLMIFSDKINPIIFSKNNELPLLEQLNKIIDANIQTDDEAYLKDYCHRMIVERERVKIIESLDSSLLHQKLAKKRI